MQELGKLHSSLVKKRKYQETLDTKIATHEAEVLILEETIKSKKATLENSTNKEQQCEKKLGVAQMFDDTNDRISELESTAEDTEGKLEDVGGEVESLRGEVEELREELQRVMRQKKARSSLS